MPIIPSPVLFYLLDIVHSFIITISGFFLLLCILVDKDYPFCQESLDTDLKDVSGYYGRGAYLAWYITAISDRLRAVRTTSN